MSKCIFDESRVDTIHYNYYSMAIPNKNGSNDCIEYDEQTLEKISVENFTFIVHKNDTCIADCIRRGCLYEKFLLSYLRHFINPNQNVLEPQKWI